MTYLTAPGGDARFAGPLGLSIRGRRRRIEQPLPPGPRHEGYLVGLRGHMAERLLAISPLVPPLVAAARRQATALGVDPATVRFDSRVTSFRYPGRLMADGLILGHTPDGTRAVVFAVFEVKATTDLAKATRGVAGGPPQLQKHIDRLLAEGVVVRRARAEALPPDQKWFDLRFPPGRVGLAPGARAFLVTPADVNLTPQDRSALLKISLPVQHLRLSTPLAPTGAAAPRPRALTARAARHHDIMRRLFLRQSAGRRR